MTVSKTTNFGLVAVYNEVPSASDWAATYWNWLFIDKLIYGVIQHNHDGAAGINAPVGTLILTGATGSGILPSGTTYYIGVTYVDDLLRETAPSTIATVTTPAAISPPATPTNNDSATPTDVQSHASGLEPGEYWYKIAFLKGTGESVGSSPVYVNLPIGDTYEATIHFASINSLANGATGIRVYRKINSTGNYVKIVDLTDTSLTSYTDDNTAVPACDIRPRTTSTIDATNTVSIDWSGLDWVNAYKIRIYVSTTNGKWSTNSFLAEATMNDATPITGVLWTGATPLTAGKPPEITQTFSSPSKINLTSAAEVQGKLPLANISDDLTWKAPVATYTSLPVGNTGDARVVLDEASIYVMDDAATPAWTKISGGIGIYTYPEYPSETTAGEVIVIQEDEGELYELNVAHSESILGMVHTSNNFSLNTGYYRTWNSSMEEINPAYGHGAVRFNSDSKKFEYWDGDIATPAWVEVT
jgi:hypothetical protein